MQQPPVGRRRFLRLSAGAVAGLPLLLQACGSSAGAPSSATGAPAPAGAASAPASGSASPKTAGSGLKLPTYVPPNVANPDIAGSPQGLPPAYFSFPKDLTKSVQGVPGKGGDFAPMVITNSGPVAPLAQNPAWQEVNKQLGVNLKPNVVAAPDYITKTNALVAAGDVPELFLAFTSFPGMPDMLNSLCADLTPYLAGDAIKDYPNLAATPSFAWPFAVFSGKIFGIPSGTGGLGGGMLYNQTLLDQASITSIANTDDFTRAAKAVTKAGSGLYAFASYPLGWFLEVFRAPNGWRLDGGKLTKDWETPEYKAAVAYLRSLYDAGVINPDSPNITPTASVNNWYAAKSTFAYTTYANYMLGYDRLASTTASAKPRAMQPFGHDGGKGVQFLGSTATLTLLKKASPDRIKELLAVLNFTTAPFGTQEWLLLHYGIKDVDFKFDDKGNPLLTQQGSQDVTVSPPWLLGGGTSVLYDAAHPDFAKQASQDESAALKIGVADPTAGLYSPANAQKGVVITMKVNDGVKSIVFGREDITAFDQLVKDWRAGGGDQVRAEFEQLIQSGS